MIDDLFDKVFLAAYDISNYIELIPIKVDAAVADASMAVDDFFSGRSYSSNSSSTASVQQKVDLQVECSKYRKDAEKINRKAVEESIMRAEKSVKTILKKLNTVGRVVLILDDSFDSAINVYLDFIRDKISPNEKKFLENLEIEEDEKREDVCRIYVKKVAQEAERRATEHLNKIYYDALDVMTNKMELYLKDIEGDIRERKKQLDKLEEDEEYIKQACIDYVIDISYLNCIRSECVG